MQEKELDCEVWKLYKIKARCINLYMASTKSIYVTATTPEEAIRIGKKKLKPKLYDRHKAICLGKQVDDNLYIK
jgi:hypothetical protein